MLTRPLNLDNLAHIHFAVDHCFGYEVSMHNVITLLWEHSKLLTVASFLVNNVFSDELISNINEQGFNNPDVRAGMILDMLIQSDKVRSVLRKYGA